jgi:hypothetical protein
MPIRFQADADFNQIIVNAIVRRDPEIDFRTATVAGLAGLKDADVLALAARDSRVLITPDHSTMPRHFGEFIQSTPSPGLIVVPQGFPFEKLSIRSSSLGGDAARGVGQPDRVPADLMPHVRRPPVDTAA